jgi:hypothetical protein
MEVKTLVEFYDIRPLENVLGVEIFRPQHVVYICPEKTPKNAKAQLKRYFSHRGIPASLEFQYVNTFDAAAILQVFRKVYYRYPEAVMDITGGTDALLFAAGFASSEKKIPVVTYSRTQNRFYSIHLAPSAHGIPCDIVLSVEDCFLMAGGFMRQGRVDNSILSRYMDDIGPFFDVFLKYRSRWDKIVNFIQRVSLAREDGTFSLSVRGNYTVKGEHGSWLTVPEEALRALEEIGMISGLEIDPEEGVAFCFRDAQIRAWLRDVGSVLELYVYKACLDSGVFDDVRTSAVVDWSGGAKGKPVSNELDVMCTRGIMPVFISCKTCAIRTEALNELAILRDRFGGEMARAAIVTAEPAGIAARNRAAELNIRVIDLNDLKEGSHVEMIRRMMKHTGPEDKKVLTE